MKELEQRENLLQSIVDLPSTRKNCCKAFKGVIEIITHQGEILYGFTQQSKQLLEHQKVAKTYGHDKSKRLIVKMDHPLIVEGLIYPYVLFSNNYTKHKYTTGSVTSIRRAIPV